MIIETEQGQGNRFRVRGGFGLPWRDEAILIMDHDGDDDDDDDVSGEDISKQWIGSPPSP